MKKILPLLFGVAAAAILFIQIENAAAQGLTGKDFLRMEEKYQAAYVSGFWDGTMVCCEVEEANDNKCNFRDLLKVMYGVDYRQLIDLLKKYLKDNPNKKHKPIGLLFYKCIEEEAQ